ncbi:hypothetical protein TYRP_009594 [Tyrophagus putrescentiae]|nr:hypothetical protein TYRP_009594 [Tyrophagus putrescentiae]
MTNPESYIPRGLRWRIVSALTSTAEWLLLNGSHPDRRVFETSSRRLSFECFPVPKHQGCSEESNSIGIQPIQTAWTSKRPNANFGVIGKLKARDFHLKRSR